MSTPLQLVWLLTVALGLAIFTWFVVENPLPAVWREVRCLPVYLQPAASYREFLNRVRAGEVRLVQLNPEQATVYFYLDGLEHRVRVPELDPTWQDLLLEKDVRVVVLEGGC